MERSLSGMRTESGGLSESRRADTPIVGLAFSPDGRTLATWGRGDDSTKIWNLGAGSEGALSKAEAEFKEAQAALEAKKAEVQALQKVLEKARETGYPKDAYARDLERYYAAIAGLQKAQGDVLTPSKKLYDALTFRPSLRHSP